MHHVTHVPLAGAFGGGGLFGIGYAMGVLDGLREQGIDLTKAPMVGTSAGSWAAAATALGVGFDQLAALDVPRFPDPRSGVLANSARRVFGNAMRGNVHAIACALPRLRRTELDGAKFPLSTIVAASSAVPGLLSPQRIEGRWYIDGGVRSGVSVDLAAPADLLIVVASIAGNLCQLVPLAKNVCLEGCFFDFHYASYLTNQPIPSIIIIAASARKRRYEMEN